MKTSIQRARIEDILKKGKRYAHDGIVVVCGKNNHKNGKKYAILVSKKTARSSVTRNRMRRMVREAIKTADIQRGEFVIILNSMYSSKKEVAESIQRIAEKM